MFAVAALSDPANPRGRNHAERDQYEHGPRTDGARCLDRAACTAQGIGDSQDRLPERVREHRGTDAHGGYTGDGDHTAHDRRRPHSNPTGGRVRHRVRVRDRLFHTIHSTGSVTRRPRHVDDIAHRLCLWICVRSNTPWRSSTTAVSRRLLPRCTSPNPRCRKASSDSKPTSELRCSCDAGEGFASVRQVMPSWDPRAVS